MKKIVMNVLAVLGFILLFYSVRAYAAESVEVTIIQTPVQITNISVYSPLVEYPVIFYKGICYIPMTYNLCENMDLAIGFDAEKGLFITKHYVLNKENRLPFGSTNYPNDTAIKHTAYIPEYPIYLNGVLIDNLKEEYPILNFRNITYFPLTYRFATEEFDIQVRQSEEYFLIADRGEYASVPAVNYFGECDDGSIDILVQSHGKTVYEENGEEQSYGYFWWDTYKLYPDTEKFLKTATYTDYLTVPEIPWKGDPPYSDKITHKDNRVYYDGMEILNFDGRDFLTSYGREYTYEDITFISLYAVFGDRNIPVLRYPETEYYLFVKDEYGIKQLSLWNKKNMFSNIFKDGKGGFYIASDYYYTLGSTRMGRDVGSVYHYTADGDFYEVTVPDTNSVTAIGTYGTKLYVYAIYHENDKTVMTPGTISAVNSGYYEIDTESGKCTKLRPYFPGKVLLTSKGELYVIKEFGFRLKIMNIKTGKEIVIG